jgi:hypothetical protein
MRIKLWAVVVHGSSCGVTVRTLCQCEGRALFGEAGYRRFAVTPTTGCDPGCHPEVWVALPAVGPGDAVPQALVIWALFRRWGTYEVRESDRLYHEWFPFWADVPAIPAGVSGQELRAWAFREVVFIGLKDGPIEPPSDLEVRDSNWYLCVPFHAYPFLDRCILCIQWPKNRSAVRFLE